MWIIIEALLILGCVIYAAVSTMSFLSQSGLLGTQLDDVQTTIDHKQARLDDYRIQAEQLQETVPNLKTKVSRFQHWINALKKQKMQVDAQKNDPKQSSGVSRDAAIRRNLSTGPKRKEG
ncbi:MAG: hypothetical protein QGG64_12150 [Candidatus Latescibacteria bacterium]|jgi:septal ring factor EnvC (AmiA/AmiB activator)|nr:hypothetical protein [Candidatus Latescibacterota bacterium]